MPINEQVKKQTQVVARCEKSLALEKLKKRRADTRRKIELGGLVIKAGMDYFNKTTILGAICHTKILIENDSNYEKLFCSIGESLFMGK
jgi:hypothetical protein